LHINGSLNKPLPAVETGVIKEKKIIRRRRMNIAQNQLIFSKDPRPFYIPPSAANLAQMQTAKTSFQSLWRIVFVQHFKRKATKKSDFPSVVEALNTCLSELVLQMNCHLRPSSPQMTSCAV